MAKQDYGDLPEKVAAGIARLIDAERRAHPDAWKCPHCRRTNTLRIQEAEVALLEAIRITYITGKVLAA